MDDAPSVEQLPFEMHIFLAERALRALALGLRSFDEDLVLLVAAQAREEIRASYRAWEQLGRPADGERALTALQDRGHRVLSDYLAYPSEIGSIIHATLDAASEVALVAMLWKVSDALDQVDEADRV